MTPTPLPLEADRPVRDSHGGRQGHQALRCQSSSSLLHQPLFLFLFRHKRKLKAIVAGSAGETVMGGEMRGQLGLLGAWSTCLGGAQASPAPVECAPLPSVPPLSSLQGTGALWTSWTCPIPTSIPLMGEWSPQALLGALRGGCPGPP